HIELEGPHFPVAISGAPSELSLLLQYLVLLLREMEGSAEGVSTTTKWRVQFQRGNGGREPQAKLLLTKTLSREAEDNRRLFSFTACMEAGILRDSPTAPLVDALLYASAVPCEIAQCGARIEITLVFPEAT